MFLQRRQQNLISGKGWTCIYLQKNFQFKEEQKDYHYIKKNTR